MPFKIFVLAAGVFELSLRKFVLTLLVARGLRYTVWAVVGMVYREEALRLLKAVDTWSAYNLPVILTVLGLLAVGGVLYWTWRRRRRAPGEAAGLS
jgi:LPXTG-motif cell wall-anchored protein